MKNLYNKSSKITKNLGNNVFCFNEIENTTIYIPSLITLNIDEFKSDIDKYLKIWQEIVFREKDKKSNNIIEYKWLNNFLEIKSENKTIYIIDNHNHALYFWYKEYFEGNIQRWLKLIHIDQHTDMNDNKYKISQKNITDNEKFQKNRGVYKQELEQIFNFTNNNCNVWNFIKPTVEEWLIWNITQINTEYSLLNIQNSHILGSMGNLTEIGEKILDIDLDFRAPEMSIEDYKKTINITKNLIKNTRVVTIATSPYFLDQNIAIKIIKDLFK